jgi:hypothetical protein
MKQKTLNRMESRIATHRQSDAVAASNFSAGRLTGQSSTFTS